MTYRVSSGEQVEWRRPNWRKAFRMDERHDLLRLHQVRNAL
jgi:hypothetical protein